MLKKKDEIVKAIFMMLAVTALAACGDEKIDCKTNIECTEEKESLCEPPAVREYPSGEVIEVRACTYITYEHCFEKTVCKEVE